MKQKTLFYNQYHKKNSDYFKIITENNVTYFPHLRAINLALLELFKKDHRFRVRVLDVGCGVGTLAFYLAAKGCIVDAIDISSSAVSICQKYKVRSGYRNIHFFCGDIEKKLRRNKYDLIVCTEVIEHLGNDTKFLKSLASLAKKNSFLILSTPSINAPLYKLGLLSKFDQEVGHLRRYKGAQLKHLLVMSGFSIEATYRIEGIIRNALYTLKPLGWILKFIRGPIVPIFHSVDLITVRLFGESNFIVIARK